MEKAKQTALNHFWISRILKRLDKQNNRLSLYSNMTIECGWTLFSSLHIHLSEGAPDRFEFALLIWSERDISCTFAFSCIFTEYV